MRYAAIIIMNNGTKYFLNGLWNHDHEARESIQEWLDHKFMNCVTAENETAFRSWTISETTGWDFERNCKEIVRGRLSKQYFSNGTI